MRDHDHIGLSPDNAFGPANVRVNDPFAQNGVFEVRQVPSTKRSNFESIRFGVVETLQISNSLLLAFLGICSVSASI